MIAALSVIGVVLFIVGINLVILYFPERVDAAVYALTTGLGKRFRR